MKRYIKEYPLKMVTVRYCLIAPPGFSKFMYITVEATSDKQAIDKAREAAAGTFGWPLVRRFEFKIIAIMDTPEEQVYIEPDYRKSDQHYEMAGLAFSDGDAKDGSKHTMLARLYQQGGMISKTEAERLHLKYKKL